MVYRSTCCHLSNVGKTEVDHTSDIMATTALPSNIGFYGVENQNVMIFYTQIRWHRVWMARVLDGTRHHALGLRQA